MTTTKECLLVILFGLTVGMMLEKILVGYLQILVLITELL